MNIQNFNSLSQIDNEFEIIFQNELFDFTNILNNEQNAKISQDDLLAETLTASPLSSSSLSYPSPSSSNSELTGNDVQLNDLLSCTNMTDVSDSCSTIISSNANILNDDFSFLDELIESAMAMDDLTHQITTNKNECVVNINELQFDEQSVGSSSRSNNGDACLDLENDEYDSSEDTTLRLSEEEKILFKKEGYEIPNHMPLTKNEEKILKLIRRKIRNKQSAHQSRERKKKYVDGLEKRVDLCTKENQKLQKEILMLRSQNIELKSKLQKMQTCLVSLLSKTTGRKISTSILFVSFLITFCVYPLFDSQSDAMTTTLQAIPYTSGNARTLKSFFNDQNLSNYNDSYGVYKETDL